MILVIGDSTTGMHAAEVAEVSLKDVVVTGKIQSVYDVENLVKKRSYDEIIVDVSYFTEDPETVATELKKYSITCGKRFIILALGMAEYDIVKELIKKGFYLFVTNPMSGKMKEELRQAMSGYSSLLTEEETTVEKAKEKEKSSFLENKPTSIAIAGCCRRIGTTTLSLQIALYLESLGIRCAYVSMSGNDIQIMRRMFTDLEIDDNDKSIGRIRYEGLDMYDDPSKTIDIEGLGYKYIVYDYGDVHVDTFNQYQFIDNDLKAIVCGIKPLEIVGVKDIINSVYSSKCYYYYNFVEEKARGEVADIQRTYDKKTFLIPYIPNPYVLNQKLKPSLEKFLMTDGDFSEKKKKPKKFGIF